MHYQCIITYALSMPVSQRSPPAFFLLPPPVLLLRATALIAFHSHSI